MALHAPLPKLLFQERFDHREQHRQKLRLVQKVKACESQASLVSNRDLVIVSNSRIQ